jgi:hypothetical protein
VLDGDTSTPPEGTMKNHLIAMGVSILLPMVGVVVLAAAAAVGSAANHHQVVVSR